MALCVSQWELEATITEKKKKSSSLVPRDFSSKIACRRGIRRRDRLHWKSLASLIPEKQWEWELLSSSLTGNVAVGRKQGRRLCPWLGGLGCTVDTLLTFSQDQANGLELLFLFYIYSSKPGVSLRHHTCNYCRIFLSVCLSLVWVSLWEISISTKIVFVLKIIQMIS